MEVINEKGENVGLRNIMIIIEAAEYIKPAFDATDILFEVKFRNELIGKSDNYLSFEEEEILVDYQISWEYDISTEKALDDLISNPIQFIVWQSPGHHDPAVSESDVNGALLRATDSVFSLYESNLLGINEPAVVDEEEAVETKVTITEPKKDKSKKAGRTKSDESARKSKGKLGKTASKASAPSTETSDKSEPSNISAKENDPFVYGCANLALEALFSGDRQIALNVELTQTSKRPAAEFGPLQKVPVLRVKVCLDQPLFDANRQLENVLYFSIESLYNLPENFTRNMNYQLATVLPSELTGLSFVCLEHGSYVDEADTSPKFKRWPNLYGNDVYGATNERIQETATDVNNKANVNLTDIFPCTAPRVEWNAMKTCWMNEQSSEMLKKALNRYRLWPVEMHVFQKIQVQDEVGESAKVDKMKATGSKTSKGKAAGSKNSLQTRDDVAGEPLHLMAFADITTLLYPGVTKTRVVCPMRTFQADEMKRNTGLEDSFFAAKLVAAEAIAEKTEPKGKQRAGDAKSKDKASTKAAKGKKDGSKKSDKRRKSEEVIPPEPVEMVEPIPEPSRPVLSATGAPTFVILEFELLRPFRPRRSLADLTNELTLIIPSRPPLPKSVLTTHFAVEHFRECICTLIRELNDKYQALPPLDELSTALFVRYLHKDGSYQTYLTTLLRSVTLLISEKFKFDGETKNSKVYENFIANIYVHLVDEVNKELNGLTGCGIDTCKQGPQAVDLDYLYCYEEAVELQAPLLAERYILETLAKDTRNADVWLHYAVYQMGQGLQDQAFECLKESLALRVDHKYSLLLFAVILFDKEDYYLAETAFLSVVANYATFMDGWLCLYLFYKARQNAAGCDVCWEMVAKCESCDTDEEAYLDTRDGLAWTTSMCVAEHKFMRTALVLIKLRALKFAELALNCDEAPASGACVYYQGVVQYFLGNYEQALEHLMLAQRLHGADYAVNSTIGHCHYRLGHLDEAKEAYEFVVYAYNRPEDMHMLFTNLAMIAEKEGNLEMARKYLLIVCKLSPTSFSWLLLGAVFYKENNMLSAEQCLAESNILDNRLPETWAYLTLVNLKNGNHWEAQQCYIEMRKHNLKNESLLSTVEDEMIQHKQSP